jgi:hypothetical protein
MSGHGPKLGGESVLTKHFSIRGFRWTFLVRVCKNAADWQKCNYSYENNPEYKIGQRHVVPHCRFERASNYSR